MSLLDFLGGVAGAVPGVVNDMDRREAEERRRQELADERERVRLEEEARYQRALKDQRAAVLAQQDFQTQTKISDRAYAEQKALEERQRKEKEQEAAAKGLLSGRNGMSATDVQNITAAGGNYGAVGPDGMGPAMPDALKAKAAQVFNDFNQTLSRLKGGEPVKSVNDDLDKRALVGELANMSPEQKRAKLEALQIASGHTPDTMKPPLTDAQRLQQSQSVVSETRRYLSELNHNANSLRNNIKEHERNLPAASKAEKPAILAQIEESKKELARVMEEAAGQKAYYDNALAQQKAVLEGVDKKRAGAAPASAPPAALDEEARSNAANTNRPAADGLFDALIKQESGGQQFDKDKRPLTSKAGAIGVAQVMPATAPEAARLAGVEFDDTRYRNDPEYNRALGRAYLNKQLEDFGDPAKALAAYNAGPDRVRAALEAAKKNGKPEDWLRYMPAETQAYVPAILSSAAPGGAPKAQPDATSKPNSNGAPYQDGTELRGKDGNIYVVRNGQPVLKSAPKAESKPAPQSAQAEPAPARSPTQTTGVEGLSRMVLQDIANDPKHPLNAAAKAELKRIADDVIKSMASRMADPTTDPRLYGGN